MNRYLPIIPWLSLLLLWLLPILALWEDSPVNTHDNLEDRVAHIMMLAQSKQMFASPFANLRELGAGAIPRMCLPSPFHIQSMLYVLLNPYDAYIIHYVIVHVIAFVSMWILMARLHGQSHMWVLGGVAYLYSILYFPNSAAVAGLPALVWAAINVATGNKTLAGFAIFGAYPFFGYFIYTGIFVIGIISFAILLLMFFRPQDIIIKNLIIGLAIMICSTLIVECYLAISIISGFESHRIDWPVRMYDTRYMAQVFVRALFSSLDTDMMAYQSPIISAASIIIILVAVIKRRIDCVAPLVAIICAIIIVAFARAIEDWSPFVKIVKSGILADSSLKTFGFYRVYNIHTLLWYILLGSILQLIMSVSRKRARIALALLLILAQNVNIMINHQEARRIHAAFLSRLLKREYPYISMKNFYSSSQFDDVVRACGIDRQSSYVVSVGLHPAVAMVNGFNTLDFYLPNYPLSYKRRFREVIAPELDKSQRWRDYFDYWGSRCYILLDDIQDIWSGIRAGARHPPVRCDINLSALRHLGATHIISAVELVFSDDRSVSLLCVVADDASVYRLYIYKLMPAVAPESGPAG